MKVDDKLVFLDGQFPSILFPVGRLQNGGSCAYLTEHCLLYCPAKETNRHEKRALAYFRERPVKTIVEKILEDISTYGLMHLYWWSWGDCPPDLTDKITHVMIELSETGVLQNGFTRNIVLWKTITDYGAPKLRIGTHVDTLEEVNTDEEHRDRIVCRPDVDVGKAELYFNGVKVARCCGLWCDWLDIDEVRAADCQECYLHKQGCFYKSDRLPHSTKTTPGGT